MEYLRGVVDYSGETELFNIYLFVNNTLFTKYYNSRDKKPFMLAYNMFNFGEGHDYNGNLVAHVKVKLFKIME